MLSVPFIILNHSDFHDNDLLSYCFEFLGKILFPLRSSVTSTANACIYMDVNI